MTSNGSEAAAMAAPDSPDADIAARNRLVITLLLTSTFVVVLNETIMAVALPHLMVDLHVTANAVQWLTTAFMLTMAVVIPITGFLLQRLHTRPVYMLAMSAFSLGTLMCALAPGLEVLIVGRVVQASGTAIMMPLLMTTVMNLVPPAKRGRTMGNISTVIAVAPAIGPTISGIILSYLHWRWIFWLVLPIALIALAFGTARMKNVSTPREAPFDFVSVILSIVGFGGSVYALSTIGEGGGEQAMPIWLPGAVGLLGLALFVLRQLSLQKRDAALLDLRTFLHGNFTISVSMMAVFMGALFGTIVLLPIYLQNVVGLEPVHTGLLLLPGGLLMGLLAPFVGRLYDRVGPRPLLVPGSIIVSTVLWALTLVDQSTPVPYLLTGHIVFSLGLAMIFTPLFSASLGSLPPPLYPHGSAVVGTTQQLSGAVGTALLVAVMSATTASLLVTDMDAVTALSKGVTTAFMFGATLSLFGIVAALFIKRPPDTPPVH